MPLRKTQGADMVCRLVCKSNRVQTLTQLDTFAINCYADLTSSLVGEWAQILVRISRSVQEAHMDVMKWTQIIGHVVFFLIPYF